MATAAAIKSARSRSLGLAREKGHTPCSWSAHLIGYTLSGVSGELVSAAWWIDSASSAGQYTVSYIAVSDHADCECKSAQHGRPCWHAGLALMCGREITRLYLSDGRTAESTIARYAATAEENARALGYLPALAWRDSQ